MEYVANYKLYAMSHKLFNWEASEWYKRISERGLEALL